MEANFRITGYILAAIANDLPVFEDNFDTEPSSYHITSLRNWTVTGNVDVIGPERSDYYPNNGNYLDLDGTDPCASSTIQSIPISLSAGTRPRLSFRLGNNLDGAAPGQWSGGVVGNLV